MGFTTWARSPSPSLTPSPSPLSSSSPPSPLSSSSLSPPSKLPVDFSPPLIAMVVVVAAAFLVVTYPILKVVYSAANSSHNRSFNETILVINQIIVNERTLSSKMKLFD
ncbi:hypothetical protein ES319_A11G219000v1 [Gossypium barbadense]|uniref:Transmembrane protein n=2 Tax=Gossypium TaxID=3633 RepID=A0A5J5TW61_GOSBA|nr:hypothetical protein ES319_A11G219000v1 [Gossypium barbadense]TYG95058.1 hypothetical protein ES288_A11G237400v1 [Gossypium darwinii]